MSKDNPNCKATQTDTHASSCFKVDYPACAKIEHTHAGRACYDKDDNLKCSRQEHTHDRTACARPVGPLCGGI